MIQLNFLNAVVEDNGNGLRVNGKDLNSIISAALGTIKKIPGRYEYLGEENKGKPFESQLCNVSVTIDDISTEITETKIENMAETYGYVTTITGRKRRLPDMQLEDKDDYRYQEAHRQSLNSVIQGSSADIMKLSMIAIYNDPRYKALDCHMIITVHDELIMEVPEDHIKEGAELLVGTMKRVGHSLIDLPMSVDAEVNDYWYGENLAEKYGV